MTTPRDSFCLPMLLSKRKAKILGLLSWLIVGLQLSFCRQSRLKLLNKLSSAVKGPLTKFNSSLSAKVSDFKPSLFALALQGMLKFDGGILNSAY